MTTTSQIAVPLASRWRRLLAALKSLDDAFDHDPAEQAADHFNGRITALQETVRALEARLSRAEDRGS